MTEKKAVRLVSRCGHVSASSHLRLLAALIALVLMAPASDSTAQSGSGPSGSVSRTAAPSTPSKALADLIKKLRQNEALYKDFDLVVYSTTKYVPSSQANRMPAPISAAEFRTRQVVSSDRFYFAAERAVTLSSGKRLSEKRVSVFDGSQTVSIEVGNSVAVDRGRWEPLQFSPPRELPLAELAIDFPLSVYLQGTTAVRSHPKVSRSCRGPRFDLAKVAEQDVNRVDAEVVGEENIGGLACVKVRVLSWYHNPSPPQVQYFWLAKQRNYNVAQWRTAQPGNGQETPKREGRTTRWLELAQGVWLPGTVEVKELSPEVVTGSADAASQPLLQPESTWELTTQKATLSPRLPESLFQIPKYPASLPVFVFDRDGRLIDAPKHPTPVKAERKTTLEAIVKQLVEEEKKYDKYEVVTNKRHKGYMNTAIAGSPALAETRQRTVVVGNRFFQERQETNHYAPAGTQTSRTKAAFDGRWTRQRQQARNTMGGSRAAWDYCGVLNLGPCSVDLFRPHTTLLFESMWPSLSLCLTSGWNDYYDRDSSFTMAYEGDERVGDLYCHKIKRGSSYLWLARDRNLLPVRQEWHLSDPRVKLPYSVDYVNELREVRLGLWFPERTTHMSFEESYLFENRPRVSWRRDMRVEELTVEPKVDDKLFTMIEIPAGASVSVRDENNESLGDYQQKKAGNIEISPEELDKMRRHADSNESEP
jgi:hypothetical protein